MVTADVSEPSSLLVKRWTASYENQSQSFILNKDTNHRCQYAQLYFARLMELSAPLRSLADERWPGIPDSKLLCLEDGKEHVAIGTIYKDMKLKPTVLKEYTEEQTMAQQLAADTFCDDDDGLVLEDDSARIRLSGAVSADTLTTGVVAAVFGTYDAKAGALHVKELAFAGAPMQPARTPLRAPGPLVAFASGLCIGDAGADMPRLLLLLDWLKGLHGDVERCSRVARLVICGGVLGSADALASAPAASKAQRFAMQAVGDVDRTAAELASALPVDLMPGPGDLSNHALPQQPLHRCLFPAAAPYESFQRVTNPYRFSAGGAHFLATAGQNVHDMLRYTRGRRALEIMEDHMKQRHLCATAPDTLACYPYSNQDPFIVRSSPHVYVAGNQAEFGVAKVPCRTSGSGAGNHDVTVLSVPAFAVTGQIALVDLATLAVDAMSFATDL